MKLVYKKDYPAVCGYLVKALFYAFLKISAVLRPRKHGGKAQGKKLFSSYCFGNPSLRKHNGYALGYGCLAHACFSHKAGIVFRPAGKHLYDAFYLLFTAEYRVELFFPGGFGEILAVL